MKKVMMSLRIPQGMIDELKDVGEKDHFLDVSEVVRDIIRQEWIKGNEK